MIITGVLRIDLQLPHSQSLKQKRSVVKSLKDKLGTRFNVSVAEVDHLDKWQIASLAIAMVSNRQSYLESSFEKLVTFMDREIAGKGLIISRELSFF